MVEGQRPLPLVMASGARKALSLSRLQPPEGTCHQHSKQSGLVIGYDGKALLAAVDSYPPEPCSLFDQTQSVSNAAQET